jgi:outer membrane protein
MNRIVFIPLLFLLLPLFLVFNCQAGSRLTLIDYTAIVLNKGDDNKSIQEKNQLAKLDVELAASVFNFQYFPIATFNESYLGSTQGVGFEVKKKMLFGSQVTLGTKYERFKSDSYSSESPKSYLRLEQGLFRQWGYDINSMPLKVAEIGQHKLALQSELQTQNLITRASYLYLDVVLAFKQHKLSKLSVKRSQLNLEVAESRHSLGLVAKTDIYRAKLSLISAKSRERNDNKKINNLLRNLSDLAGGDISFTKDQISTSIDPLFYSLPLDYVAVAMGNRGDVRALTLDVKLAQLSLYKAEKQLTPDIRLTAEVNKYINGFENDSGNFKDDINWNVGLSYRTGFNLDNEKNNYQKQKIAYGALMRYQKGTRRRVKDEIMNLADNIRLIEEQQQLNGERLTQATNAVDLAQLRYERGLSNNLDLMDAEDELQQVQVELVRQQANLTKNMINFAQAMGILSIEWLNDVYKTEPI